MTPAPSSNVASLAITLSITLGCVFSAAEPPAEFDADSPMEIAASQAAVTELLAEHEKAEKLKDTGRPSQHVLNVIQAMGDPEDRLSYGVDSWDANSLGNHRVVIDVSTGTPAVAVHIPWRRRDHDPQKKRTILIDAKTGRHIDNVYAVEINREFGDFVFEPITVPGTYYMYYMPYEMTDRNYPQTSYLKSEQTADEQWLQSLGYHAQREDATA